MTKNNPNTSFDTLMGRWRNSNSSTNSVIEFTLSSLNDGYQIEVVAMQQNEPMAMGSYPVSFYVAKANQQPYGFHATFEHDGYETTLAGNLLSKNVYVVQTYTHALAGSPGLFTKEYFCPYTGACHAEQ